MNAKVINPFGWLSKDGKLLLAEKAIRTFAYGFLSVILAIYLRTHPKSRVLLSYKQTVFNR